MDLQSFLKKKKKKKSHAPAPAPSHEHHKKNETTPAPGPGHHKKNETTPEKKKKAVTNTPAAAAVGEGLCMMSRCLLGRDRAVNSYDQRMTIARVAHPAGVYVLHCCIESCAEAWMRDAFI